LGAKSKMKKDYFKVGNYSNTYRVLDKIHNYNYLSTKTPFEMEALLISHFNDLGFEYEKDKIGKDGKKEKEIVRDYPYLTKQL